MIKVRVGVDAFWHFLHRLIGFALLYLTTASIANAGPANTKTTARDIKIVNMSGSRIELYWVHVSALFQLFFGGPDARQYLSTFLVLVSHFVVLPLVRLTSLQPDTREGSLMSNPHIMNGGDFTLNSFVAHEFEIRELPSASSGVCNSDDQTCANGFFAVSENDDQGE